MPLWLTVLGMWLLIAYLLILPFVCLLRPLILRSQVAEAKDLLGNDRKSASLARDAHAPCVAM